VVGKAEMPSKASEAVSYLFTSECLSARRRAIFVKRSEMLAWSEDPCHNRNIHHLREDMQSLDWQQGDELAGGRMQLWWPKGVLSAHGPLGGTPSTAVSSWGPRWHQPPRTAQCLRWRSVASWLSAVAAPLPAKPSCRVNLVWDCRGQGGKLQKLYRWHFSAHGPWETSLLLQPDVHGHIFQRK